MKTLRQSLPSQFSILDTERAKKMLDEEVIEEVDGTVARWPGKHKNVFTWWKLKNGYAVGWNENPAIGWSFPVVKL